MRNKSRFLQNSGIYLEIAYSCCYVSVMLCHTFTSEWYERVSHDVFVITRSNINRFSQFFYSTLSSQFKKLIIKGPTRPADYLL